jgi:type IV pilus assembly protein PilV
MIALIIIAIGLLGVARMQALALSSASVSRLRSLAALEAASLASAMHANRAYWAAAALAQPIVVNGAAVTTSDSSLTAALNTANNAGRDYCTPDHGAPCTSVALAAADLHEWATDLNATLPNATARITCPATNTPLNCTIQINWFENAVAINKQQADAAAAAPGPAQFQTPTYTLIVEP